MTALLELLLEDAAVTQPFPFDVGRVLPPDVMPGRLGAELVGAWIEVLRQLDLDAPGPEYITAQARLLGLPTRLGRGNLHKVKPHHRILELPGTGGQLAHHIVSTQPEVFLQDVFTIACDGWRELTLAGLVVVDCGLTGDHLPILDDPRLESVRAGGSRFDYVIGLEPDKGGAFEPDELGSLLDANGTLILV